MGQLVRAGAVASVLIAAAGCGVGITQPTAAPANRSVTARQVPAADFVFRGIAGDGRIADHFTMWEYQTINFKAVVDNPDGTALTYKWDTYGHIWGKKDQPEIRWSGPWDGWYDVSCTVSDAAGNKDTRRVSVKVWAIPTPPPPPPIPHP